MLIMLDSELLINHRTKTAVEDEEEAPGTVQNFTRQSKESINHPSHKQQQQHEPFLAAFRKSA